MANPKKIDFRTLNHDATLCELIGNSLIAVITRGDNTKDAVVQALEAYVTLKHGMLADETKMLDTLSARLLGKVAAIAFDGDRELARDWISARVQCIQIERTAPTLPAPAPEPKQTASTDTFESFKQKLDDAEQRNNLRQMAGIVLAEVRRNEEMDPDLKTRLIKLVRERVQIAVIASLPLDVSEGEKEAALADAEDWIDQRLDGTHQRKPNKGSKSSAPPADVTAPDAATSPLN